MVYSELESNYYVISPIERENKKIYICIDKQTAEYEFFVDNFSTVEKVDEKLETELRKIYHKTISSVIPLIKTEEIGSTFGNIDAYSAEVRKLLQTLSQNLKKQTKLRILSLFDHTLIKKYDGRFAKNTIACYAAGEKAIYIKPFNDNELQNTYVLLHECLHCSSLSSENTSDGFLKKQMTHLMDENMQKVYVMRTGMIFNEAVTEILTIESIKKLLDSNPKKYEGQEIPKMGYDIFTTYVESIISQLDIEKVKEYYFNADLDGMIDYIDESFHIQSKNKVYELIYSLDALHCLMTKVDEPKISDSERSFLVKDMLRLFGNLEKNILEMRLNKYAKEGFDISGLKIEDIIPDYKVYGNLKRVIDIVHNDLSQIFGAMKFFANFNDDMSHKMNYWDSEKLLKRILDNNPPVSTLPESMKTPETYYGLLSDENFCVIENDKKYFRTNYPIEKFLQIILDPANDYMPRDEKKRETFVRNFLLYKKSFKKVDIVRYLPKETLANVINAYPNMVDEICFSNMGTMVNISNYLSSNVKKSPDFKKWLIDLLTYTTKEKSISIINKYYDSFKIEERTEDHFQTDMKNFFIKTINDKNYIKDYELFVEKMKKDKQSLQQREEKESCL